MVSYVGRRTVNAKNLLWVEGPVALINKRDNLTIHQDENDVNIILGPLQACDNCCLIKFTIHEPTELS